jgi:hypothetical protein
MAFVDFLYEAADRAGFLKEAVWIPSDGSESVSAKVDFRAPDQTVLDGLGLSTDYAIHYPASALVGLASGETLTIDGQTYRVREVRALSDGSEKRATLTKM